MEYSIEMGSGAMLLLPSLIKIGSDIQKLTKEFQRQTANLIS